MATVSHFVEFFLSSLFIIFTFFLFLCIMHNYHTCRFKVNENGLALYLPALEDSECIHCIINDAEANRMVFDYVKVDTIPKKVVLTYS